MGYYGNRYSTTGHVVLQLFLFTLKCYPPPNIKKNVTVTISPFMYATELAVDMEGFPSDIIMKFATSFYT